MASTIQIDRLLETVVRKKASDLHLAVGKPPVVRLHGSLRELQTKVLEPEDTMSLMKSITPERIQQEFEETGSGDFGFAYGDDRPLPRLDLQAEGVRVDGAASDPQRDADVPADRPARAWPSRSAAGRAASSW